MHWVGVATEQDIEAAYDLFAVGALSARQRLLRQQAHRPAHRRGAYWETGALRFRSRSCNAHANYQRINFIDAGQPAQ
jgi:hypothetical protein